MSSYEGLFIFIHIKIHVRDRIYFCCKSNSFTLSSLCRQVHKAVTVLHLVLFSIVVVDYSKLSYDVSIVKQWIFRLLGKAPAWLVHTICPIYTVKFLTS